MTTKGKTTRVKLCISVEKDLGISRYENKKAEKLLKGKGFCVILFEKNKGKTITDKKKTKEIHLFSLSPPQKKKMIHKNTTYKTTRTKENHTDRLGKKNTCA